MGVNKPNYWYIKYADCESIQSPIKPYSNTWALFKTKLLFVILKSSFQSGAAHWVEVICHLEAVHPVCRDPLKVLYSLFTLPPKELVIVNKQWPFPAPITCMKSKKQGPQSWSPKAHPGLSHQYENCPFISTLFPIF